MEGILKPIKKILPGLLFVILLSSCMRLNHVVGEGAKVGVQETKKEWYILYGFVPLNHVESKELAEGANSYTIKTEVSLVDAIINLFLSPLTITTQTVTVTR